MLQACKHPTSQACPGHRVSNKGERHFGIYFIFHSIHFIFHYYPSPMVLFHGRFFSSPPAFKWHLIFNYPSPPQSSFIFPRDSIGQLPSVASHRSLMSTCAEKCTSVGWSDTIITSPHHSLFILYFPTRLYRSVAISCQLPEPHVHFYSFPAQMGIVECVIWTLTVY